MAERMTQLAEDGAVVRWFEHPDGRVRYRKRNTIFGWVEEREPEGVAHVTLPDGFRFMCAADEVSVEHDGRFFIGLAEDARERYLANAD